LSITSKLYLRNDLEDNKLKEAMEQLFFEPLDEVYVLPVQVERVKNLLSGLTTAVGSIVDYPLAISTMPKLLFEVFDLFRNGADLLLINLSLARLKATKWQYLVELEKNLHQLIFGWGEFTYLFKTKGVSEMALIEIIKKFDSFPISKIALEVNDVQTAIHDVSLVRYEARKDIAISVYINSLEKFSSSVLFEAGANQVGWITP